MQSTTASASGAGGPGKGRRFRIFELGIRALKLTAMVLEPVERVRGNCDPLRWVKFWTDAVGNLQQANNRGSNRYKKAMRSSFWKV